MIQQFRHAILFSVFVVLMSNSFAQAPLRHPIKLDNQNPLNCYDKYVTMYVPLGSLELEAYPNSYFTWYYGVVNPLDEFDTTFNYLGVSTDSAFSFIPRYIFNIDGSNEITQQKFIHIKAELRSQFFVYKVSSATPLQFSPSSPVLTIPEIITTPSCVNAPTGSMTISLSKVTDSVLYIVRYGANTNYCNPETNNPPCFNVVTSGYTTVDTFTLHNIPAGNFTVLLANKGLQTGICNNVYSVTVPFIPPVEIDSIIPTNNSCFESNDGKIEMYVSNGDSSTYHFRITPNRGSFTYSNHKAVFSALPAGTYVVSVLDTCNVEKSDTVVINQPPKIIGTVTKVQPLCQSPANGYLTVNASFNFQDVNFTTFTYLIYKDSVLVDSLYNSGDSVFVADSLLGGNYSVIVISPNTPHCPGINETFYLPDNKLRINIAEKIPVSCNGGSDGKLRISGIGGSGLYRYFLRQEAGSAYIEDTLGTFENLAAGNYVAVLINKNTGCNDSATLVINIPQPDTIRVDVVKSDVQCFNSSNGQLIAFASGGNGTYNYKWERKLNDSSWADYPGTGDTIFNLSPGTYRAKVTDIKNCIGFSGAVYITEPDSLQIDSIRVNDIACKNEFGSITMYASGGNGGYIQQICKLPSTVYTDFTASTSIDTGSYLIRIKDAKDCITNWSDTIRITSPSTALDFTYIQATVNGYNILCFGADDGTVTITPSGGNGSGYTGYTYTFDNRPWQQSNIVTNIPAGMRAIKVKDARGCIKEKQLMFTQPNDSLHTQLISKRDVICFGAATGRIEVAASGGVLPYRFSKDSGNSYQPSPVFDSLPAGTYHIVIKDRNNCSGIMTIQVQHLFTQIISNPVISNVSCNGGTDGNIDPVISGGEAPYNYQWAGGGTTATRNNLGANTYQLTVGDHQGCFRSFIYTVTQPAALQPVITPYPVCYGSSVSFIKVKPVGGTPPYQYSKDSGLTWQNDSVFTGLTAGNYQIKVKDSKNCTYTGSVSLITNTANPNLNFIISSNQHAMDTITMKEISWIKPDSVKWQFDPAAIIIDPNVNEPKIKFITVDTVNGYRIKLTGYYAHCVYEREKFVKIQPYDPNAAVGGNNYNRGIRLAELFPNPNNGDFTLNVEFYKIQRATVYISQLSGTPVTAPIVFAPSLQITRNFTGLMNGQSAGTYLLKIISDYDTKYILFVKY